MSEVARLAGVSLATVSFVVNGTKPVTAETRARVEQAMVDVGYRPNVLARALASRRTRVIALLYPVHDQAVAGAMFGFFSGAGERAHELGYTLVVSPAGNDREALADLVGSGLVEGVIVMEVRLDDYRVDYLESARVPYALIGRTARLEGVPYVDVDFETTIGEAVDALYERGHRRMLLLEASPWPPTPSGYAPPLRIMRALEEQAERRGFTFDSLGCEPTAVGGARAAARLLAEYPDVTAVITHNDGATAGFVTHLRRQGITVPDDISIVMIASSAEMAAMIDPPLEVWEAPAAQLGRMGVEVLVGALDGAGAPVQQSLASCRRIAGASLADART
ncbi:LacI family DNA-binding transcriptional regulator [Microbacterium sp. BH-3-3-3]|uniref:LacI family DNA-binding transcriptional regulator n=1 Tax=Microbacterium sp. BH-3-3-3 TaxID=1906742 RepID=UPI0015E17303|nr:LacI family DNA-binding transcriptional regulator [Microbacterium sp. BH-3-3-3]